MSETIKLDTTVPAYGGIPQVSSLPTNLVDQISDTSSAPECFINQRFSAKLQAFLIGYTGSIYSNYSVYAV